MAFLILLIPALLLISDVSGIWFNNLKTDQHKAEIKTGLVTYRLYTRQNPKGEIIWKNYDAVGNSTLNSSHPTRIFMHGWFQTGRMWYIINMKKEFLKNGECNFIAADWSSGAFNINYFEVKKSAKRAGREVADFINWLSENFNILHKDVHLIGHSMGSQVAGEVGRSISHPKIGRISGLDPAQPGFNLTDPSDTLGPEDADFVDIIHTTFTAIEPMGHVDFYPNGGSLGIPLLTWIHSHLQAAYIYTASINGPCKFTAYQCPTYKDFKDSKCSKRCSSEDACNRMGYYASLNGAKGSLQLHIKETEPYC